MDPELEHLIRQIAADVADMKPRVTMLNHWHTDIDNWRRTVDITLRLMKWPAILGGVASIAKLAIDTAHTLGLF